jgi:hypothetical protein
MAKTGVKIIDAICLLIGHIVWVEASQGLVVEALLINLATTDYSPRE